MVKKTLKSLSVDKVKIEDSFWSAVQNLIVKEVLPYQKAIMEDKVPGAEKSHAIENFRIAAGEAQGEFYGMVFQDSDVAKWLEAVAYSLVIQPNPALEKEADDIIALIGRAQQDDGYLDTYFIVKEPEHKWKNLLECHELYCAGHMIEAGVAYYQATGKDSLLNIVRKNADLICSRFGEGRTPGIPGHQEIELALLKLYDVTGEKRYLDTAKYFLDERGKTPGFFQEEAKKRDWVHFGMKVENRAYNQDHLPVKQQDKAVGHSVRAGYMYTAMADLASRNGDEELYQACLKLWDNMVQKQMYLTGGLGSTVEGEAFTFDYDLPNDTIYAETCASVAMVFFARRMLEIQPKGEYADVMEKELYNGILSGMQLDGKRFFYVNPLEVVPGISGELFGYKHVLPSRPAWYACACCPPNVARLMTSLGEYGWGENEDTIFSHIYLGGEAEFSCAGGVSVACRSEYPWKGHVEYTVSPKALAAFQFAVHVPGWCKKWELKVNGQAAEPEVKDGYAYISREWKAGDTVVLEMEMKTRRVYANTHVRKDAGCVALVRGPIVYCFEEKENGKDLSALRIPRGAALEDAWTEDEAIGKVLKIKLEGVRMESSDLLYDENPPRKENASMAAIPYYMWGNRGLGEMRVWMLED